jgi:hypothetical protein
MHLDRAWEEYEEMTDSGLKKSFLFDFVYFIAPRERLTSAKRLVLGLSIESMDGHVLHPKSCLKAKL